MLFSHLSTICVILAWHFHLSVQKPHLQSGKCETLQGDVGRCVRPFQCNTVDMFQKFPTFHCETDNWFGVCCPLDKVNATATTTTTTTTEPPMPRFVMSHPYRGCTAEMMRPDWKVKSEDNQISTDSLFAKRQLQLAMEIPGPPLRTEDFNKARKLRIRRPPKYRILNPMLTPGMFEGDIIGDWNDFRHEFFQMSSKSIDSTSTKTTLKLWKGAIVPYVISSAFTMKERAAIARAFLEFQYLSCVRFVPRTKEKDYVFIVPQNGCYSHVGRKGGRQVLSLGPGCVFVGTIQHELMHVLGFWHEQSRLDRDLFIKIVYSNIMHNACHNFIRHDLRSFQELDSPYDLSSIMHYGAYDFSKNGQPTILVRKRRGFAVDKYMGQRHGLSKIDVMKLNALYGCRK